MERGLKSSEVFLLHPDVVIFIITSKSDPDTPLANWNIIGKTSESRLPLSLPGQIYWSATRRTIRQVTLNEWVNTKCGFLPNLFESGQLSPVYLRDADVAPVYECHHLALRQRLRIGAFDEHSGAVPHRLQAHVGVLTGEKGGESWLKQQLTAASVQNYSCFHFIL